MSRTSFRYASLAIVAFTMLPLGATGQPVVVVDGSSNPELISNEALYLALSGFLEGAAASDCSSNTQNRLSTETPCMAIEGVDMARATQLAREYKTFVDSQAVTDRTAFCNAKQTRAVPFLNAAELAAELNTVFEAGSVTSANYFLERGSVLLGQDGISRLVNWANDNLKSDIKERNIDYVALLDSGGFTPDGFASLFCLGG